jgi:hypothetical protein
VLQEKGVINVGPGKIKGRAEYICIYILSEVVFW